MIASSPNKAFVLSRNLSHLVDVDSDAFLVKFPGSENIAGWILTQQRALPERIYFEADFEALSWHDFPSNDANWPIMSNRMMEVLLSVGVFHHRLIPVIMLDYRLKWNDRFCPDEIPKPEASDYRFSAVQLTEHLDAFDWDRSEYQRDPDIPDQTAGISKLVLKEPTGGFPPLFRLSAAPGNLFVSSGARQALEKADIRGLRFWPLSTVRF